MTSETRPLQHIDAIADAKLARMRHIVERDAATGQWMDEALCGYAWDVLKPPSNGTICSECLEIAKGRQSTN